jgi:hypothetical protein
VQEPPRPRRPLPGLARALPGLALGVTVAALGVVLLVVGLSGILGPASTASPSLPDGSAASPAVGVIGSGSGLPRGPLAPTGSGVPPGGSGGASTGSNAPGSSLPAGDPVLVGAGDIARCDASDDKATARLLEQTPGIVFTLGDNAYENGTEAELRDCYAPSWGRVLDRTRFAVAGNHDYGTPGAEPFKAYFGQAAVRDGATWFSEDVGSWHVVVLDSNCADVKGGCGPDSPQVQWLRADLAAMTARCTLALWHQPRFSSGMHGDDADVGPFWDTLYAAGADLVLNGHDHDYERFAAQDPAGRADPERGITEIVVGTGGAELRDFGPGIPNTIVRSSIAHGVLVLTLHPSGWSFQFLSTDGSFSDQGSGSCH